MTVPPPVPSDAEAPSIVQPALSRQTRLAVADQVVIGATNFATNILVGRALVPTAFGQYILALNLLYLIKGLQEALVAAPFAVHRQHRTGASLIAYRGSNAGLHAVTTAAFTLTVLLAVSLFRAMPETRELARVGMAVVLTVPCLLTREYCRRISFAEFRSSLAVIMDGVIGAVQLAMIFLLWHGQLMTPFRAFLVIGVSCAVGAIVWKWIARYEARLIPRRCWVDWQGDLRFGRWICLTFLLGCSTPYLMPWLLATLGDGVAVARYGAAFTIVGFANLFVLGVNNFFYPLAARSFKVGGARQLGRTLATAALVFSGGLGLFCLLLWTVGDPFLGLLFDDKYTQLRGTLTLLGVFVWGAALSMTAGIGLTCMFRPQLNLPADLIALGISWGLAWLFIPRYGETGAAAALAVGVAAGALVRGVILGWASCWGPPSRVTTGRPATEG
ncbi:MAG: hypothetical protein AAGF97_05925 [Planctomycetota bacterium]